MPCVATATSISSGRMRSIRRSPEPDLSRGCRKRRHVEALGAARGIARFVVVQPSFYGADNSATLDALDELAGNGRGVAVIDPKRHRRNLPCSTAAACAGLRINLYSPIKAPGGDTLEAAFAATAAAARMHGWHVQVIAPLPGTFPTPKCLRNRRCQW